MARYVGLILFACLFLCSFSVSARDSFDVAMGKCQSEAANHDWPASHRVFLGCEPASYSNGPRIDLMIECGEGSSPCPPYAYTGFPYAGDVCVSGAGSVVWLGAGYDSPGPTYSNVGSCQCVFSMIASWSDKTVGNCVQTGNQIGEFGDDPVLPDAGLSSPRPPCGGGSCYDPGTNQFCMVDDSGKQTCVAGPSMSGSASGETPQSCGVFNGKTICAGTPDAPKPNSNPEPPLVDHQEVQTSDGQGAPPSTTVVNVYDTNGLGNNRDPGDGSSDTGSLGNGGNNGSEGKGDENGKCQDGSTPSASGCGAGYADRGCDQPPTCSGDPLMCAALREQHATRCSADKRYAEVSDAGAAGQTLDGMGMVGPEGTGIPGRSDVFDEVSLGGDDGQGSGMDDSGWGWSRSCPIESKEFTLMGQGVTIDYGQACGALSLGGVLVMLMAYLAAARIVVMGSN